MNSTEMGLLEQVLILDGALTIDRIRNDFLFHEVKAVRDELIDMRVDVWMCRETSGGNLVAKGILSGGLKRVGIHTIRRVYFYKRKQSSSPVNYVCVASSA